MRQMKVQIINYSEGTENNSFVYSRLANPKSPDEFDLNIIDLADEEMWYCDRSLTSICCLNDLRNLEIMIRNANKTKVLFVLPQDIIIHLLSHIECLADGKERKVYKDTVRLKDNLDTIVQNIYTFVYKDQFPFYTYYENTTTKVGDLFYNAAFYFKFEFESLTYSDSSNKPTTIKCGDSIYLTTLDIFSSNEHLENFINKLFSHNKIEVPDWINDIDFYNDNEQNSIIRQNVMAIEKAQEAIESANQILEENTKIKSILYTNGNELVEVVCGMLEKLLDYDLSGFIDEKKEDFLIKKPEYTLIGEVKGITSNVKNDNISQLENHYQQYMDRLQENGIEENVHQILVINPLRSKPLSEREPVNEKQINLAKRNKSLIIETKTLLRLFEEYLRGKIAVKDCENLFTTRIGLLEEKDFIQ